MTAKGYFLDVFVLFFGLSTISASSFLVLVLLRLIWIDEMDNVDSIATGSKDNDPRLGLVLLRTEGGFGMSHLSIVEKPFDVLQLVHQSCKCLWWI